MAPMQTYEIQSRLKQRGITQKAIARKLGISEMSVSDVIRFRKPSRRVMKAVCDAIEMPVETVFAQYYANLTKRRPRQ